MEIQIDHWSHEHPMVLKKGKEIGTLASGSCKCYGCLEPVSGRPFYSCKVGCLYVLHKVCAELPNEMNYLMHPQHTLTLSREGFFECNICRKLHGYYEQFVYCCSKCNFKVDVICAWASHIIKDKCHMHPLIPIQLPICFICSICGKKEEGVSYKCGSCPFWVHQDCTVLPNVVECRDHDHQQLTLLPSIPYEVNQKQRWNVKCNICNADVTAYETVYSCVGCLFFSHARCAICEKTKHLPAMRKVISPIVETLKHASDLTNNSEGKERFFSDWTTLISSMVEIDFNKQISNPDKLIDSDINHSSHDHVLHLHDGQWNDNVCEKVCEACAEPILGPSYGCTQCDYFLHKCCIGLPIKISHPFHPAHGYLNLFAKYPNRVDMFRCSICYQMCNTFGYKCDKCDFEIDVKCASLSGRIKHESHKHTLSSNIFRPIRCSACGDDEQRGRKCETCSFTFNLCLRCTRLPRIVKHRYCKCQGLRLQYYPLKNYYDTDYYCDLCETKLNPQKWFYHCGACDQFAHPTCLIHNAGDSNIKFGKRYNLPDVHEHELILSCFTYEYSNCKRCVSSLNNAEEFAVGFECATCPYFKIHLTCVPEIRELAERIRLITETREFEERDAFLSNRDRYLIKLIASIRNRALDIKSK